MNTQSPSQKWAFFHIKMAYIFAMSEQNPKKPSIDKIKKREDFLRLRSGAFARPKGFYLQAMPNQLDQMRVGFTASKKVGNAVTRNRAKRRLRALAYETLSQSGKPGWDYVFIAKNHQSVTRDFDALLKDAQWALQEVHRS